MTSTTTATSTSTASPVASIVVVLVRTHSAGNVGSVARLCGNYGTALRLVTPECSPVSHEARMFAAGDLRPLDAMTIHDSVGDAVKDVDVVVGTSSKLFTATESPVLDVAGAARLLPTPGQRVAWVFGNEREGLTVDEGAMCHRVVRLHTPGYHDSLNLSHAVGAVLALATAATSLPSTTTPPTLTPRSRERLIDDWLGLLADIDYFKTTTREEFRPRLARLVDKMTLDDRDAALVQGMLRSLAKRGPEAAP